MLFISCSKDKYHFIFPLKQGRIPYILTAEVNSIKIIKGDKFFIDIKKNKDNSFSILTTNAFFPYPIIVRNFKDGLYVLYNGDKYLLIPVILKRGWINNISFKEVNQNLFLKLEDIKKMKYKNKLYEVFVFKFKAKGNYNVEGKLYLNKELGLLKLEYVSKKGNSYIKVIWNKL